MTDIIKPYITTDEFITEFKRDRANTNILRNLNKTFDNDASFYDANAGMFANILNGLYQLPEADLTAFINEAYDYLIDNKIAYTSSDPRDNYTNNRLLVALLFSTAPSNTAIPTLYTGDTTWLHLSDDLRLKALIPFIEQSNYEAAPAINSHKYIGEKTDATQLNEFPRKPNTTLEKDVMTAAYLEGKARFLMTISNSPDDNLAYFKELGISPQFQSVERFGKDSAGYKYGNAGVESEEVTTQGGTTNVELPRPTQNRFRSIRAEESFDESPLISLTAYNMLSSYFSVGKSAPSKKVGLRTGGRAISSTTAAPTTGGGIVTSELATGERTYLKTLKSPLNPPTSDTPLADFNVLAGSWSDWLVLNDWDNYNSSFKLGDIGLLKAQGTITFQSNITALYLVNAAMRIREKSDTSNVSAWVKIRDELHFSVTFSNAYTSLELDILDGVRGFTTGFFDAFSSVIGTGQTEMDVADKYELQFALQFKGVSAITLQDTGITVSNLFYSNEQLSLLNSRQVLQGEDTGGTPTDLSAYSTTAQIDAKDQEILRQARLYTDANSGDGSGVDLTAYPTRTEVITRDNATLASAKTADAAFTYDKATITSKDNAILAAANRYADSTGSISDSEKELLGVVSDLSIAREWTMRLQDYDSEAGVSISGVDAGISIKQTNPPRIRFTYPTGVSKTALDNLFIGKTLSLAFDKDNVISFDVVSHSNTYVVAGGYHTEEYVITLHEHTASGYTLPVNTNVNLYSARVNARGGSTDLSGYYTKAETDTKIAEEDQKVKDASRFLLASWRGRDGSPFIDSGGSLPVAYKIGSAVYDANNVGVNIGNGTQGVGWNNEEIDFDRFEMVAKYTIGSAGGWNETFYWGVRDEFNLSSGGTFNWGGGRNNTGFGLAFGSENAIIFFSYDGIQHPYDSTSKPNRIGSVANNVFTNAGTHEVRISVVNGTVKVTDNEGTLLAEFTIPNTLSSGSLGIQGGRFGMLHDGPGRDTNVHLNDIFIKQPDITTFIPELSLPTVTDAKVNAGNLIMTRRGAEDITLALPAGGASAGTQSNIAYIQGIEEEGILLHKDQAFSTSNPRVDIQSNSNRNPSVSLPEDIDNYTAIGVYCTFQGDRETISYSFLALPNDIPEYTGLASSGYTKIIETTRHQTLYIAKSNNLVRFTTNSNIGCMVTGLIAYKNIVGTGGSTGGGSGTVDLSDYYTKSQTDAKDTDTLDAAKAFTNTKQFNNANLADNSIDGDKLANASVDGTKLALATILSGNIADGNIGTPQLANSAVTTQKVNNASITESKLSSAVQTKLNASGPVVVADGSITTAKIATDAVTGAKIANNAVGKNHIIAKAVGLTEFDDQAIATLNSFESKTNVATGDTNTLAAAKAYTDANVGTTSSIADGAITTIKIADLAVAEDKLTTAVQAKLNAPPVVDLSNYYNKQQTYSKSEVYNKTEIQNLVIEVDYEDDTISGEKLIDNTIPEIKLNPALRAKVNSLSAGRNNSPHYLYKGPILAGGENSGGEILTLGGFRTGGRANDIRVDKDGRTTGRLSGSNIEYQGLHLAIDINRYDTLNVFKVYSCKSVVIGANREYPFGLYEVWKGELDNPNTGTFGVVVQADYNSNLLTSQRHLRMALYKNQDHNGVTSATQHRLYLWSYGSLTTIYDWSIGWVYGV